MCFLSHLLGSLLTTCDGNSIFFSANWLGPEWISWTTVFPTKSVTTETFGLQGAPWFEHETYWSAVNCSATELYTQLQYYTAYQPSVGMLIISGLWLIQQRLISATAFWTFLLGPQQKIAACETSCAHTSASKPYGFSDRTSRAVCRLGIHLANTGLV